MKTNDTEQVLELLGCRLSDPLVARFVTENNAALECDLNVGRARIECKEFGCDIQFITATGSAEPVPNSYLLRAYSVRLFSPIYCVGRDIEPFRKPILSQLAFPFDQDKLVNTIGPPSRISSTIRRYTEYDIGGFTMRFVLARSGNDIVLVEIVARQQKVDSVADRVKLLHGRMREQWSARAKAYVSLWGEILCIYLDVELGIDVLLFKKNDCYILATSGASNYQMAMPNEDDCRRFELIMYVRNPEQRFIERLAQSAAFPRVEKTSLGHGDTINWEIPIESGSILTADLIIFSIVREDREFSLMQENESMKLLWCVPISSDELQFKKSNGIERLLAVFDKVKHPKILDPLRKSCL